MEGALRGKKILITGITDGASLAMHIARRVQAEGAELYCTGLGRTAHHGQLSEKGAAYLDRTYADFQAAVREKLGADVFTAPLDATVDGSIVDAAKQIREKAGALDGVLHSIAMDKTIRGGTVKPFLETTREEFMSAMDVSAYSLLSLTRELLNCGALARGASIIALSYLGSVRVMHHPYRNIGVSKAALERIVLELAYELGKSHEIRVNALRFSPYTESKAGGAIEGLARAVEMQNSDSPLGNARPEDLAEEVAFLLRPNLRITGEIRHVDGGYHMRG